MGLDLGWLKNKYTEVLQKSLTGIANRVTSNPAMTIAQPWTVALPEQQYNQYKDFLTNSQSKVETPKFQAEQFTKLTDYFNPIKTATASAKAVGNVGLGVADILATQLPKLGYDFGNLLTGGQDSSGPKSAPFKYGEELATNALRVSQNGYLNTYLDTIGKPQAGKWNIAGMNIPDVGLSESTLSNEITGGLQAFQMPMAIAGLGNPAGIATYLSLGGAINTIMGDPNKSLGTRFSEGMTDNASKAATIVGFNKFSNPLIDKIGTGASALPLRSAANVIEGVAIDRTAGLETTVDSILLDALFPVLSYSGSKAFGTYKKNRNIPVSDTKVETETKQNPFKERVDKLITEYRNDPIMQAEVQKAKQLLVDNKETELELRPIRQEANLIDRTLYNLKQEQIKVARQIRDTKGQPAGSSNRAQLIDRINTLNAKEIELKTRAKELAIKSRDIIFGDKPIVEPTKIDEIKAQVEGEPMPTKSIFETTREDLLSKAQEIEAKIGDLNSYRQKYETAGDVNAVPMGKEVKDFMDTLKEYALSRGVPIKDLNQEGINYLFRADQRIPDYEIEKYVGGNIEDAVSYDPTKSRTRKIAKEDLLGFTRSAKAYIDAIDAKASYIDDQAALRNVPRVVIELENKISDTIKDSRGKTGGNSLTAQQVMDYVAQRGRALGIKNKQRLESKLGYNLDTNYSYLGSINKDLQRTFVDWDIKRHTWLRQLPQEGFDFSNYDAVYKLMRKAQGEVGGYLSDGFMGKYVELMKDESLSPEQRAVFAKTFIEKTLRKMSMSRAWNDLYDGLAEFDYSPSLKKQIGETVRDMASRDYEMSKIQSAIAGTLSNTRKYASVNLITTWKGAVQNWSETLRLFGLGAMGDPKTFVKSWIKAAKTDDIYKQYGWAGNLSYDNLKGQIKEGRASLGFKNEMADYRKGKIDKFWNLAVDILGLPFSMSESVKSKVYLYFLDAQGRKLGLQGNDLDEYVFNNYHTFSISGSELSKLPVNRGAGVKKELQRSAMQFAGYPIREIRMWIDQTSKSFSADPSEAKSARKFLLGNGLATVVKAYALSALTGRDPSSFAINIPFLNPYQDKEPIQEAKTPIEFMNRLPFSTPLLLQLAVASGYVVADMKRKMGDENVDPVWETQRAYDMLKTSLTPLGNQVKQTSDALKAIQSGEVRTWDNSKLKYTVDNSPQNVILGTMFGRPALSETKEYNQNKADFGKYPFGQLNMDEKQTKTFEDIKAREGKASADRFYDSWLNKQKPKEKQITSLGGGSSTNDMDFDGLKEEIRVGSKSEGFTKGAFIYKSDYQEEPAIIDYRKILPNSSDTVLERAKKENDRVTKAVSVFYNDEIGDSNKEKIYKDLGFTSQDIEMEAVVKLPTQDRVEWIKSQIATMDIDTAKQFLYGLATEKSITGKTIFTSAVAKEMGLSGFYKLFTAKDTTIADANKAQQKALKNLSNLDNKITSIKVTPTKAKDYGRPTPIKGVSSEGLAKIKSKKIVLRKVSK